MNRSDQSVDIVTAKHCVSVTLICWRKNGRKCCRKHFCFHRVYDFFYSLPPGPVPSISTPPLTISTRSIISGRITNSCRPCYYYLIY